MVARGAVRVGSVFAWQPLGRNPASSAPAGIAVWPRCRDGRHRGDAGAAPRCGAWSRVIDRCEAPRNDLLLQLRLGTHCARTRVIDRRRARTHGARRVSRFAASPSVPRRRRKRGRSFARAGPFRAARLP